MRKLQIKYTLSLFTFSIIKPSRKSPARLRGKESDPQHHLETRKTGLFSINDVEREQKESRRRAETPLALAERKRNHKDTSWPSSKKPLRR